MDWALTTFRKDFTPSALSTIIHYSSRRQSSYHELVVTGIFPKAFDIVYKDQMITRTKGMETLSFKLLAKNLKDTPIEVEDYIVFDKRIYVVKKVDVIFETYAIAEFHCVAAWYLLSGHSGKASGNFITGINVTNASYKNPRYMYNHISSSWGNGTKYTLKQASLSTLPSYTIPGLEGDKHQPQTPLWWLRYLAKYAERHLWFSYDWQPNQTSVPFTRILTHFETKSFFEDKIKSMHDENMIILGENANSYRKVVDSSNMVTEYLLYGQEDGQGNRIDAHTFDYPHSHTFNYEWFNKENKEVRYYPKVKIDERFNNPDEIRKSGETFLETYSEPIKTFEVENAFKNVNEIPGLLQHQLIVDPIFNETGFYFVTEREINYTDVSKSKIRYQNIQKDIIDMITDSEEGN